MPDHSPDWNSLVDDLPDLVVRLDRDFRHLYVNRQWLAEIGIPRDVVLGKTPWELGIPDALCELLEFGFQRVLNERALHELKCLFEGPLGEQHYAIRMIPELGRDGEVVTVLALIRNITAQFRAEAALAESEVRFQTFMNHSPGIAWMKDEAGRYVYFSPRFEQLFGLREQDWRGHTDADLWSPEIARMYRDNDLAVLNDSKTLEVIETAQKPDGSISYWKIFKFLILDTAGRKYVGGTGVDITERKLAEEVLQESEMCLRAILETGAPVVVGMTPDYRLFEWNHAAERIYGYSRAEVLGEDYMTKFLPEEARAGVAEEIRLLLAGRPTEAYANDVLHRDGSRRTMLWNACRVLDGRQQVRGLLAIGQDITDLQHAERATRQSAVELQALMNAFPDLHFWIDADGTIRRHHAGARTYVPPEQFLNHRIQDILPEDLGRRLMTSVTAALSQGRIQEVEYSLIEPDGVHWYDARVVPLPASHGVLAVIRDVTARRRAEEESRKLQAQLQHSQKLESLGVLAGGIAHDFNNILTSIMGFTDLALTTLPEDSSSRMHLERVMTSARRAAELTQQMLAYSGKGKFVVQGVNLSDLIQEIGPLLQMSISKKARVQYRLQPDLPDVRADAAQLRQVVMNLIINASDALEDRDGEIAVTTSVQNCDRAELAQTYLDERLPSGWYVILEVTDTGVGMDAETRIKIFDPFFTTKSAGRGLGLSAVSGIIRGHHGAIRVLSEPGRGSTFRVLLPVAAVPQPAADTRIAAVAVAVLQTSHGTVLVVDDEASVRDLAQAQLERAGFTVLTACDGRVAVEMFQTLASEVSLVLLDMTMPFMSGEETFRELQRIKPQVRVILSSGYNEQSAAAEITSQGIAGFLQKPYRYQELLEAISRAMLT